MSNEIKQLALARLANNEDLAVISVDLGVAQATLLRWKNELMRSIKNGTVDQLIDVDAAVIANFAAMMQSMPIADLVPSAVAAAERIADGVTGLQRLQTEVHSTASLAVQRLRQFISVCDNSSELVLLTEALGDLNESFFNSKSTQVNIQNNINGDSQAKTYGEFLSDNPPN